MNHEATVAELLPQFLDDQSLSKMETLHGGLINATYLVESELGEKIVLQRVNTTVFTKPELVMENIRLVTRHLKQVASDSRNLHLLPTTDGASFILDGEGGLWRAFNYLSGCIGHEQVDTPKQAYEAGKAFGTFLTQLNGMDTSNLAETIPDFHHTPQRLETFWTALKEDSQNRAVDLTSYLPFIKECTSWAGEIEALRKAGALPNRVTHNDTKISNVLFDRETQQAVCVIDLDTVMTGTMLYDFGDLVRTSINSASEAAPATSVNCRLDIFQALAKGYLEATGGTLTSAEKENLVFSAKLITFELAIRFLTDYLNGDQYFRINQPRQNLDRARNQLRLVKLIQENEGTMEEIVRRILNPQ